MPRFRAEVRVDSDQSSQRTNMLSCPKCGQKLADVEHLNGMAVIRFKCRRCGTFVKADLIGVE
jgi:ribosomal protein S27AE